MEYRARNEKKQKHILRLRDVGMKDVALVGGKNASIGEMISALSPSGIAIPDGFVVTAEAYRYFVESSRVEVGSSRAARETITLRTFVKRTLAGLNTRNLRDLARRGSAVRDAIRSATLPGDLESGIARAYVVMERRYGKNVDVAVRSSATAEDLPGASFAGEHETYLNVRGAKNVARAVRYAMASLFTDRAISYRVDKGFDHFKVALSVGVQKMVRSDKGASGVMFTLDTESGFKDVVLINGAWGLGEMIVQGEVTPDEFVVFKPLLGEKKRVPIIKKRLGKKARKMVYGAGRGTQRTKVVSVPLRERYCFILTDAEIITLARWGVAIEKHYSRLRGKWTPMDIEWAKDGSTGKLYVVQARPETVHAERDFTKIREYVRTKPGKTLARGASVGSKIATGTARVILDVRDARAFRKGEILVTDMTDPDWEPIMKLASGIVTDKGGRTSHAAIVSRELGIPCVVGTEVATRRIKTGQAVTIDTTSSDGLVLEGTLPFHVVEHDVRKLPNPKTEIMMNIATPETAFEKSFLPNEGVGLAREEFIIASDVGVHPMALVNFKRLKSEARSSLASGGRFAQGGKSGTSQKLKTRKSELRKVVNEIEKRAVGWGSKAQFYVDKLAFGIATIGAAFYPKPVIVRFSDFRSNEYRSLVGGELYEPIERNPMIGWRGASRYYDPNFAPAFALECKAMKKARSKMGLTNVIPMIPFCRTVAEGEKVLAIMKKNGLDRARDRTLKVYVMCEIPSNVILAEQFYELFDGMSIGSNDLAQLTLGLDRDSELLRNVGNENDLSVWALIDYVIAVARRRKKYIGICGQGPSDYPEFATFLVERGIASISLNPDTVVKTRVAIAKKERTMKQKQ